MFTVTELHVGLTVSSHEIRRVGRKGQHAGPGAAVMYTEKAFTSLRELEPRIKSC